MKPLHAISLGSLVLVGLAGEASAQCQRAQLVTDLYPGEQLGQSCALDAGTAVIASSNAAYVWTDAGGGWTFEGSFSPSDVVTIGDSQRYYVDVSGDTAVLGAPYHDDPFQDTGAVWVFERQGGAWVETAKLQSSRLAPDGHFGERVALQGERLAVGARVEAPGGAVYVFERSGGAWSEAARVVANDATANDYLGFGLALDGDTILAGAFGDDPGGDLSGSAYAFTFDGTAWSQEAKLEGSAASPLANFGFSVALRGDVAVIGAPAQSCICCCAGSVYVFRRQGSSWTEEALLAASDPPADTFGKAVAFDGTSILVGASFMAVPGIGPSAGRAYRFVRQGATWTEYARFLSLDIGIDHQFGESVDVDGARALVGAHHASVVAPHSGAAYMFDLDCSGHSRHCTSTPNSSGQPARIGFLGSHEVMAGDVVLYADDCPGDTFGIFVYGRSAGQYPLGNGTLCVSPYAPGILRLLPAVRTDAAGHVERALDFAAPPPGGAIEAGSTWYFQLWFRDLAAGGAGFDLSDGLAVTFCP